MINVRTDHHHKATTAIAKSAGRVVVETLNVAGMVRNRRLARAMADAGMSGFLVKLETSVSGTVLSSRRRTAGLLQRSCAPAATGRTMA